MKDIVFMTTQFNLQKIVVPASCQHETPDLEFWFDGNGKITAGGGSFERPQANAFSLVQIDDCPGSTPTCRADCYVHRLEEARGDVHEAYRKNSDSLRAALRAGREYVLGPVAYTFAGYIRANVVDAFRWHVSGDVTCWTHADLIRAVARLTPEVRHWVYTRTLFLVGNLVGEPNLVVNISADRDNYDEARRVAAEHGLRVCYMTTDGAVPDDLPDGSVIFPVHQLRAGLRAGWWGLDSRLRKTMCPPDVWGQSPKLRCGPCRRCLEQATMDAGS